MSRFISVCLRAVVALVAVFGTLVSNLDPALAATGTLGMDNSPARVPGA